MDSKHFCNACLGQGEWEAECCDGSGGCSCRGQPVYQGRCHVCHGSGYYADGANTWANVEAIQGRCYLGSGPKNGSY